MTASEPPQGSAIPTAAAPYAGLRAEVLAALGRSTPRTVLVAPLSGADDARMVAAGFAASLAAAGYRVVLVDANFERPEIHREFGIEQGPGLADLLRPGYDGPARLYDSSTPGLNVLPAGEGAASSADLLASPRLEQRLAELTRAGNWVIALGGPLYEGASSATLAPLADVTLLVGTHGVTGRRAAIGGRKALERVGARVLGVAMLTRTK